MRYISSSPVNDSVKFVIGVILLLKARSDSFHDNDADDANTDEGSKGGWSNLDTWLDVCFAILFAVVAASAYLSRKSALQHFDESNNGADSSLPPLKRISVDSDTARIGIMLGHLYFSNAWAVRIGLLAPLSLTDGITEGLTLGVKLMDRAEFKWDDIRSVLRTLTLASSGISLFVVSGKIATGSDPYRALLANSIFVGIPVVGEIISRGCRVALQF